MTETNRLTPEEVHLIHLLYAAGYSKQAIANTFGVTNACISYQTRLSEKPKPDLKFVVAPCNSFCAITNLIDKLQIMNHYFLM